MNKFLSAIIVAMFAISGISFGDEHQHAGETAEDHAAHAKKPKTHAKKKVKKHVKKTKAVTPKADEVPTLDVNPADAAPAPIEE